MAKKNGNGKEGLRRVKLSYDMPAAQSVVVAGSFSDWQADCFTLKKDKKGLWTTTLTLAPGRYEYRLLVDGEWVNDFHLRRTDVAKNEFGSENCVLQI